MDRPPEQTLAALAAAKSGAERTALLDRECAGDAELRQRVERLLAEQRLEVEVPLEIGRTTDLLNAAFREASPGESPGAFIGKYKLLEKLGEGGFGAVWAAEQKEPVKRRIALKIIKLGMDTEQVVARFEAERQALALMDHPNIAKVLDAGATQVGRPYFVMELVKGVSITKYCDQAKLPVKERVELVIKVCQAIQHAHQKGIIHRDIKPSNILITLHDGVPVPKVIDVGIAKATQAELTEKTIYTQYGQFIGTPAYMSPEQAEMSGLDIDTRSDIYSLGVLLYEILTGSTPFDTEELLVSGLDAMRKIIREREPVKPSTRLRKTAAASAPKDTPHLACHNALATDLDWIVMKCLEKDRTRRYETANALAMDLVRHLQDEPVAARPPSVLYKLQKAWRRNRVIYAAGTAVFVALAVGVIGLGIGLYRAGIEQHNANQATTAALHSATEAREARALAEANAEKLETSLYFHRIALAHREATAQPSNVKQAEALLADCPERLRNWEWHYLKRRRFVDPLVLGDPEGRIARAVAFSPDGRMLAWGTHDGKVWIWDLAGSRMAQVLSGHTDSVLAVNFCPTNPRQLASAGADNTIRLWDWQSPRELHSWPAEIRNRDFGTSYSLAFSPDGRLLAAPGQSGEFQVRLLAAEREAFILRGHERGGYAAAFSPDGRWIATGGHGGIVRLWESTSSLDVATLSSQGPPISALAFARDSSHLLALAFDGTLQVLEVATRRQRLSYFVRTLGAPPTLALALHPGGDRVATAGFDRLVTLSETLTGQQVLVLRELDSGCYCLAFGPDGNRLAAASGSGKVLVWDATPSSGTEDPAASTLKYAGTEVWGIDLAPNRLAVAAGGYGAPSPTGSGAPVLLWRGVADREPAGLPGHAIVVFSVAFDPTGRFVATVGDDPPRPGKAELKVWDLESGREAFDVEAFEAEGGPLAVAFSRDGKRILAGGSDRKIKVWDAATGRKVGVLGTHANEITALAFSQNGLYLASTGNDRVVRVWDGRRLDELQPNPRRLPGHPVAFSDLIAFSPDEKRLAVIADDDTAVIHDLEGEDRALRLSNAVHRPISLVFSPNGRWVISGGMDSTLRVWDAQTGTIRRTLKSHTDHVTRLRAAQIGVEMWMASGSRDGTVKLWDLVAIERQIGPP